MSAASLTYKELFWSDLPVKLGRTCLSNSADEYSPLGRVCGDRPATSPPAAALAATACRERRRVRAAAGQGRDA